MGLRGLQFCLYPILVFCLRNHGCILDLRAGCFDRAILVVIYDGRYFRVSCYVFLARESAKKDNGRLP